MLKNNRSSDKKINSRSFFIIKSQKHKFGDKIKSLPSQYVFKEAYRRYRKLNKAMEKEIKTKVFIVSAYRSPAYQVIIFLYYLNLNNFDFKKTARRVALPYSSEHGDFRAQAVDFVAQSSVERGKNNDYFEKTKEYKWLVKNAGWFGFKLSYPKKNNNGIMFEPWHWRLV